MSEFYRAWSKRERILENSSSGGVFTELAELIIADHGVVVGACQDQSTYELKHIIVDRSEDLWKIQRSKYYQSEAFVTFKAVKELLEAAELIAKAHQAGEELGLTQEELAFYDALTKPQAIKDFYENDVLVQMTRELTEMLRKNRTIDWQHKETARATMRKMVKRLLKKYKYPPEQYESAIDTVISQCEMWTDNTERAY